MNRVNILGRDALPLLNYHSTLPADAVLFQFNSRNGDWRQHSFLDETLLSGDVEGKAECFSAVLRVFYDFILDIKVAFFVDFAQRGL